MPITLDDFNRLISTVVLLQHVMVLMFGILFGLIVAVIISIGVKS